MMERLKITEIARATGGEIVQAGAEIEVSGISIDTRTINPGELFIAIRGKRVDGHRFVAEAIEKGAAAVMVEEKGGYQGGNKSGQAGFIQVANTIEALLALARWYRSGLSAQVVAITGSNGKTTTKEMLSEILKNRFRVVRARASFNNEIGVPLTVFDMDRFTQIGIFEIEMNELGGTRHLAEVCQPRIGIVTNVGDTHLEFMQDRSGVAQEKAELLEVLPGSVGSSSISGENPIQGVAVVNRDDPLVMEMVQRCKGVKVVTFGLSEGAEVFASGIRGHGINGSEFLLMGSYPVRLRVPGQHNIYNFLAAAATAHSLGLGFEEIVRSIVRFSCPPQRLNIRRLKGVILIDDCFNANPQSTKAALEVLESGAPKERRVAILGDMLELGEQSERLHKELGRVAAGIVDRLVVVGKQAEFIARGALETGFQSDRIRGYKQSAGVGADLFDICQLGDTILVKGSRAMALELVIQKIVRHYGEESD